MPYDPARRVYTSSTYRDLIEASHMVAAYCDERGCQHSARLDLNALATHHGMDAEFHRERLRCSKCGGRNVQIRFSFEMPRRG